MTFPNFEVAFDRRPNGWHHADGDLPARFQRPGKEDARIVISPDHRIKAWGDDLDAERTVLNGITFMFSRRGPNAFQARLTKADADSIRAQAPPGATEDLKKRKEAREKIRREREALAAAAKADRIAYNEEEFAGVFGPGDGTAPEVSPTEQARRWCYHLADKGEAKTKLYYWFRGAINTTGHWRKMRPILEAHVAKELPRAKEWLAEQEEFVKWWSEIPKKGDYNDFYLRNLKVTFETDLRTLREQISMTEENGWRGELVLAMEEHGLVEWDETEDWDDGYLWFRHSETGVLFPYNLLWIHRPEQRYPWKINDYWSFNPWALKQSPLVEQEGPVSDSLWFYVNRGATTVGPGYKLTNRLLPYSGGYQQRPNHLYRPILGRVQEHALVSAPPVPVPCL